MGRDVSSSTSSENLDRGEKRPGGASARDQDVEALGNGGPAVAAAVESREESAPPAVDPPRRPGTFTSETGREAALLRRARLQRPETGPSDADIERGLRAKAASDPRAAEVLLRWLARPHQDGVEDELDGLSRHELVTLHSRLRTLVSMEESAFEALVGRLPPP